MIYVSAEITKTIYNIPHLGYVIAFAEAAMVGGVADWFAVTALFRHPFGLKIPHTAIIPKNKKGLAFGGIVRKAVNHPGSEIDPRAYLPINGEGKLQDDGEERLLDVVVAALKKDVYR